jgi:hypothetical protein
VDPVVGAHDLEIVPATIQRVIDEVDGTTQSIKTKLAVIAEAFSAQVVIH